MTQERCLHGFSPRCPGCEEAFEQAWKAAHGVANLIFGSASMPRTSRVWDSNDDGTWKEVGS